jgi:hypothetical protein
MVDHRRDATDGVLHAHIIGSAGISSRHRKTGGSEVLCSQSASESTADVERSNYYTCGDLKARPRDLLVRYFDASPSFIRVVGEWSGLYD